MSGKEDQVKLYPGDEVIIKNRKAVTNSVKIGYVVEISQTWAHVKLMWGAGPDNFKRQSFGGGGGNWGEF